MTDDIRPDGMIVPSTPEFAEDANPDGTVTLLLMKGYVKWVLFASDSERDKVRLAKELMSERLLLHGFKMEMLPGQAGSNLRILARDERGRLSHYLSGLAATPSAIEPFVAWIYDQGFWTDDDGSWLFDTVVGVQ